MLERPFRACTLVVSWEGALGLRPRDWLWRGKMRKQQETAGETAGFGWLPLPLISEIARRALKKIIADGKPAIPPIYEKAFFNMAFQMGESDLVNRMMPDLPTGQAANILVESVKEMIASLNQDMRQYEAGITAHSEKLEGQQSDIKNLVTPEVWSLLEGHLSAVLEANANMKQQVAEAEAKLANQEKQMAQLQRKTRSDPFTGALNRYAMEEDLSEEFTRSCRYKRPFGIILADIDFFKKVNDTYGHQTGDEVLKTFVKLLRKSLREVDLIYRYGGEEFIILLPEADLDSAATAAERVRKCVESHVLRHKTIEAITIKITVSLGVTCLADTDRQYQDLIKRADDALYRAKNSGRNRVEVSVAA